MRIRVDFTPSQILHPPANRRILPILTSTKQQPTRSGASDPYAAELRFF
ncbi:hypothetical protein NSU18_26300 [Paenibacillus sp. FSL H8-0048]